MSRPLVTFCRLAGAAAIGFAGVCRADVALPRIFSDHAVLQRGARTPVWGTARPGEAVRVEVAGAAGSATADAAGTWTVRLDLQKVGEGPFELTASGDNRVVLRDILIGEVWLCSGQSNMRFHLARSAGGPEAAARAGDPGLRLLSVGLKVSETPEKDIKQRWSVCDSTSAAEFSAVGYYFGQELRRSLKTPVGLVSVSWAGSCIEAWMSPQALASDPDFLPISARWKQKLAEYPAKKEAFEKNREALLAAWQAEAAKAKAEGKPEPLKPGPGPGPGSLDTPSGLFQGEIMPVAPYGLRGVLWYQGEQNSGRGVQYRKLLPALIADWRRLWCQGDFPFLVVQLPNYGKPKTQPASSLWAELREAQAMALAVTNTALVVTIDVGEEADVHPKDKKTVGVRAADVAAGEVYALKPERDVYGPMFKSAAPEADAIRVAFAHASGLKTRDGLKPTDFAIAGSDRHFVWADATIEGESVVLRAAGVKRPTAVRYDWADAPHGNLCNGAGLPAAPFRTDSYPEASRSSR